jgi:excisionase family DNA binding protein
MTGVGILQEIEMKQVYTTGEAARLLCVAPRTVCKWFDSGRLKGFRVPGSQDRRAVGPVHHRPRTGVARRTD